MYLYFATFGSSVFAATDPAVISSVTNGAASSIISLSDARTPLYFKKVWVIHMSDVQITFITHISATISTCSKQVSKSLKSWPQKYTLNHQNV